MSRAGEPLYGERAHVLILGGTGEAYALAAALAGRDDLRVTSSLAGATTDPRLPDGVYRVGGFGGVVGLAAWLRAEAVALVVDASHPFAQQISRHAREAARRRGCPYLRLERPGWQAGPGDVWHRVPDVTAGLAQLEVLGVGRVFAALGARAVPQLAAAAPHFLVRGIELPPAVPANVTWFGGRGPFTVDDELHLLQRHGIEALFCRDSGGAGAQAKLEAARRLRLPVVLLDRPTAPGADTVPDVATALARLDATLGQAGADEPVGGGR